ncbi:GYF domain-containing protein [Oscillatoria laete-virens NRMC-F 0139]|nr:GYF domain-containing protein [Oscillatoria laete-virens]MDL5052334.1 GYF domain-containing protein [Oscillatoria laete-virens NRMC-F 0139]
MKTLAVFFGALAGLLAGCVALWYFMGGPGMLFSLALFSFGLLMLREPGEAALKILLEKYFRRRTLALHEARTQIREVLEAPVPFSLREEYEMQREEEESLAAPEHGSGKEPRKKRRKRFRRRRARPLHRFLTVDMEIEPTVDSVDGLPATWDLLEVRFARFEEPIPGHEEEPEEEGAEIVGWEVWHGKDFRVETNPEMKGPKRIRYYLHLHGPEVRKIQARYLYENLGKPFAVPALPDAPRTALFHHHHHTASTAEVSVSEKPTAGKLPAAPALEATPSAVKPMPPQAKEEKSAVTAEPDLPSPATRPGTESESPQIAGGKTPTPLQKSLAALSSASVTFGHRLRANCAKALAAVQKQIAQRKTKTPTAEEKPKDAATTPAQIAPKPEEKIPAASPAPEQNALPVVKIPPVIADDKKVKVPEQPAHKEKTAPAPSAAPAQQIASALEKSEPISKEKPAAIPAPEPDKKKVEPGKPTLGAPEQIAPEQKPDITPTATPKKPQAPAQPVAEKKSDPGTTSPIQEIRMESPAAAQFARLRKEWGAKLAAGWQKLKAHSGVVKQKTVEKSIQAAAVTRVRYREAQTRYQGFTNNLESRVRDLRGKLLHGPEARYTGREITIPSAKIDSSVSAPKPKNDDKKKTRKIGPEEEMILQSQITHPKKSTVPIISTPARTPGPVVTTPEAADTETYETFHYYIIRHGEEQEGPFEYDEVQAMFESGELRGEHLIWYPGLPDWTPVSEIEETVEEEV